MCGAQHSKWKPLSGQLAQGRTRTRGKQAETGRALLQVPRPSGTDTSVAHKGNRRGDQRANSGAET
jgi:hypothetical protein